MREREREILGGYKFNEGLVPIGTDIALGVDNLAERRTEVNELVIGALPREVAEVKHLRRGLSVTELLLA